MATVKNFGLTGVSSDVQWGKGGGRLRFDGTDFGVFTVNGTTPAQLNVALTPTQDDHAASKQYVDSVATGLVIRPAVRAKTISSAEIETVFTYDNTVDDNSSVTPSVWKASSAIAPVFDGVTLSNGDRVLIDEATDARGNGIFFFVLNDADNSNNSSFKRAADADNTPGAEVGGGTFVFVLEGTISSNSGHVVSSPQGTAVLGTDNIVWSQFTGIGSTANRIEQGDSDVTVGDLGTGNVTITVDNTQTAQFTATEAIFGSSGDATINTDPGDNLILRTGDNGSGISGNVTLQPGTASTTAGEVCINDENSNQIACFDGVSNAVNAFQFVNSITGNGPIIQSEGSDTSIDINITGKNAGTVNIDDAVISNGLISGNPTNGNQGNGSINTETLYVQGQPITQSNNRNAIINGNFDIWQRETSFSTPVSSSYTSDRWEILYNGSIGTFTVSRSSFTLGQTDVPGEPEFFLTWNQTVAGSGSTFRVLGQKIEDIRTFAGENITISWYAKADTNRTMSASITRRFGSGGSPSADDTISGDTKNLTTSWQKFEQIITIPSLSGETIGTNRDDSLELNFELPLNTVMTIDIAQVQVERGSIATQFEKRPIGVETELCLRYFQKSFRFFVAPSSNQGNSLGALQYRVRNTGVASDGVQLQFATPMRATPTMTFFNPLASNANWRNVSLGTDSGTAGISNTSERGVFVFNTQVGGDTLNNNMAVQWTADAEL